MRISLIAAVAQNRAIGRGGALPWHLPGDLKHFKKLTAGKPLVMGRKTFESIGRPLPGRPNVVISGKHSFKPGGVALCRSLEDALDDAERMAYEIGADEIMVIGGARVYADALGYASRIYLTEVLCEVDGNAFFPDLAPGDWVETARADAQRGADDDCDYNFVTLEKSGEKSGEKSAEKTE
jgi:dihydrofolate reductase